MSERLLRVFLVDDEKIIREGMKKLLNWQEDGFEICGEAANGKEALDRIRQTRPDIVITDLRMPGMDGLELVKILAERMRNIKVIVLTGYDEFEYAKEAVRSGVFDYLLKPVSPEELRQSLLRLKKKILDRAIQYPFEEEAILTRAVRENNALLGLDTLQTLLDQYTVMGVQPEVVHKICRKLLVEIDIVYRETFGPKVVAIRPELPAKAEIRQMGDIMRDYLCKIFDFGEARSSTRLVEKIKNYLEKNYQENITLKMLEDEFFFNASYISRVFKAKTGENYSDYLLRIRIERAKELLVTTEYSVSKVSQMAGFKNPKYFSRIFKEIVGVQPITYRNEGLKDEKP